MDAHPPGIENSTPSRPGPNFMVLLQVATSFLADNADRFATCLANGLVLLGQACQGQMQKHRPPPVCWDTADAARQHMSRSRRLLGQSRQSRVRRDTVRVAGRLGEGRTDAKSGPGRRAFKFPSASHGQWQLAAAVTTLDWTSCKLNLFSDVSPHSLPCRNLCHPGL